MASYRNSIRIPSILLSRRNICFIKSNKGLSSVSSVSLGNHNVNHMVINKRYFTYHNDGVDADITMKPEGLGNVGAQFKVNPLDTIKQPHQLVKHVANTKTKKKQIKDDMKFDDEKFTQFAKQLLVDADDQKFPSKESNHQRTETVDWDIIKPKNLRRTFLEKCTIYEILSIPALVASFLKHAKADFAGETVGFINAVMEFQRRIEDDADGEKINKRINDIYKVYVDQNGRKMVNVSYKARKHCKAHYDFGYFPHYSMPMKHAFFNLACRDVADSLGETVRRYRESEVFEKLVNDGEKWGLILDQLQKISIRTFKPNDAEKKLEEVAKKFMEVDEIINL
mmetsp:Transcript_12223/g.10874  ORF Transcript_12223/g.10874 Transcript_12223/m.10874 type:complete len:339 (-) Transcript_12223:94-1110(-)